MNEANAKSVAAVEVCRRRHCSSTDMQRAAECVQQQPVRGGTVASLSLPALAAPTAVVHRPSHSHTLHHLDGPAVPFISCSPPPFNCSATPPPRLVHLLCWPRSQPRMMQSSRGTWTSHTVLPALTLSAVTRAATCAAHTLLLHTRNHSLSHAFSPSQHRSRSDSAVCCVWCTDCQLVLCAAVVCVQGLTHLTLALPPSPSPWTPRRGLTAVCALWTVATWGRSSDLTDQWRRTGRRRMP